MDVAHILLLPHLPCNDKTSPTFCSFFKIAGHLLKLCQYRFQDNIVVSLGKGKVYLTWYHENVTVVDIWEACSISKTTFYYHLKSKERGSYNMRDELTKIAVMIIEKGQKLDKFAIKVRQLIYTLPLPMHSWGLKLLGVLRRVNLIG